LNTFTSSPPTPAGGTTSWLPIVCLRVPVSRIGRIGSQLAPPSVERVKIVSPPNARACATASGSVGLGGWHRQLVPHGIDEVAVVRVGRDRVLVVENARGTLKGSKT